MKNEIENASKTGELATNNGYDAVVARRIAKLIHKISSDEIEKYEQSKTFPFPFYVDEKLLKKLNDFSEERLLEIPLEDKVEFRSETRFPDHSKPLSKKPEIKKTLKGLFYCGIGFLSTVKENQLLGQYK